LIKSIVHQDAEGYTYAKLEFLVELEKNKTTFTINGSDLIGIINSTNERT